MIKTTSLLTVILLAACGSSDARPAAESAGAEAPTPVTAPAATEPSGTADAAAGADVPTGTEVASAIQNARVVVYKSPTCGCCNGWVEHLQAAGFAVETHDAMDMAGIKRDTGIPVDLASCHTALVDGYLVEGHVPPEVIGRLLAERPEVAGISVPGMPVGSPGMEGPNPQPYQVIAFDENGNRRVYASVDPR
ncbi:MAG: DUF411 domain-containing protein [Gemmatimonadota bacterium]